MVWPPHSMVLTQVFYCLPGYTRMDYFGWEYFSTITCEVLMTTRRRQQTRFGARLSLLRRQAYLSREQVAERSGVSVHLIQSLEQGRTCNPKIHTLLGLARSLDVPLEELINCIIVDSGQHEANLTDRDGGEEYVRAADAAVKDLSAATTLGR
jgi:transcriptional regulator with XRE-family HTH domain